MRKLGDFFDEYFSLIVSVSLIAMLVLLLFGIKKSWGNKEVSIFTDKETGVQYVSTINGGLTPRVDKNGHIMSVKVANKNSK